MGRSLRPAARDELNVLFTNRGSETNATRLIGRVVFYGLLGLTALTAIPYGTVQPWSEGIFQCTIFGLALLFVVEGYLSGTWQTAGGSLLYPVIALITFSVIQSFSLWQADVSAANGGKVWLAISADPYESRRFALKVASLTVAGALMMRYLTTRGRLNALIGVVLGVSVVSAIFGILRQTLQQQEGFLLPLLPPGAGYAQFINKNHFAFLMELGLGLGLGLIAARGVRRDRILIYVAALIAVWMALVLSNSRGGMLAMTGQLVFTLLLFMRQRTGEGSGESKTGPAGVWRLARSLVVQIVLVVTLIVAVVVGVFWIAGDPLVSSIEHSSVELEANQNEMHDGARRRDIWKTSWQMFKTNPIAGVGLGGYWAAVPQYHDASGRWTPQQAHNDYLELLASGGIIGVAIGMWFLILLIGKVRGAIRSGDPLYRACAWGATIAIAGVAIHSLFDFGLHKTINSLIFVWLLAIIAVVAGSPNLPEEAKRVEY